MKKNFVLLLSVGTVLFILSVVIWYMSVNQKKEIKNEEFFSTTSISAKSTDNLKPSISDIIQNGYVAEYNKSTQRAFISPRRDKIISEKEIIKKINDAVSFDGQQSKIGFLMPINPIDQTQLIIVAVDVFCSNIKDFSKNPCTSINRVFSYDLDTEKVVLLYEIPKINSYGDGVQLYAIATQDSKIILRKHFIGTGGVCDTVWSYGPDSYFYLDLENLVEGIKSYSVPVFKIQEAIKQTKECMESSQ